MPRGKVTLILAGFTLFITSSLMADDESKPNFFRTKFHNKKVESCVHQFPYWQEIQREDVDKAFEDYLQYGRKNFPLEAVEIAKILEHGGMLGVVVEAHEKWEVLEYIKKGYSLEEIGNGKAYKEYKPVAHAEARFKELKFYQFWYEQLFNEKPPAMRAFLYVVPFLKTIVQDAYKIEVTEELMCELVDELKKYKKAVLCEKCSEEDIEKCVRFFEKTGSSYGEERYLWIEKGLLFLRKIK